MTNELTAIDHKVAEHIANAILRTAAAKTGMDIETTREFLKMGVAQEWLEEMAVIAAHDYLSGNLAERL